MAQHALTAPTRPRLLQALGESIACLVAALVVVGLAVAVAPTAPLSSLCLTFTITVLVCAVVLRAARIWWAAAPTAPAVAAPREPARLGHVPHLRWHKADPRLERVPADSAFAVKTPQKLLGRTRLSGDKAVSSAMPTKATATVPADPAA